MTKYTEFDAELLRLIKNGCRSYGSLCARLADKAKEVSPDSDSWRVVDRRLQALRKKGLIFYRNTVWSTTLS